VIVLGTNRIQQGGFDLKAATELQLPPDIKRPLAASVLHDGRICLIAQGDPTQVRIINPTGQIEFNSSLGKDDNVTANVVLLDGGLVIPLAGRLKFVPLSRKPVQDWLAPAGDETPPAWRFLVRLDGDELIGCDARGQLTRIQLRTDDVAHLAGVAKMKLDHPIDIAPACREESLFVADAGGKVHHLNMRSFDAEGTRTFKAPVRGVWSVGQLWLIWADDAITAVAEGRDLPIRWSFDLKGLQPVGQPLELGRQIWLASRDGQIVAIDTTTGMQAHRQQIPQVLTTGLKKLDDGVFAIACDGTFYRINVPTANE
jgi:hypothetical protein